MIFRIRNPFIASFLYITTAVFAAPHFNVEPLDLDNYVGNPNIHTAVAHLNSKHQGLITSGFETDKKQESNIGVAILDHPINMGPAGDVSTTSNSDLNKHDLAKSPYNTKTSIHNPQNQQLGEEHGSSSANSGNFFDSNANNIMGGSDVPSPFEQIGETDKVNTDPFSQFIESEITALNPLHARNVNPSWKHGIEFGSNTEYGKTNKLNGFQGDSVSDPVAMNSINGDYQQETLVPDPFGVDSNKNLYQQGTTQVSQGSYAQHVSGQNPNLKLPDKWVTGIETYGGNSVDTHSKGSQYTNNENTKGTEKYVTTADLMKENPIPDPFATLNLPSSNREHFQVHISNNNANGNYDSWNKQQSTVGKDPHFYNNNHWSNPNHNDGDLTSRKKQSELAAINAKSRFESNRNQPTKSKSDLEASKKEAESAHSAFLHLISPFGIGMFANRKSVESYIPKIPEGAVYADMTTPGYVTTDKSYDSKNSQSQNLNQQVNHGGNSVNSGTSTSFGIQEGPQVVYGPNIVDKGVDNIVHNTDHSLKSNNAEYAASNPFVSNSDSILKNTGQSQIIEEYVPNPFGFGTGHDALKYVDTDVGNYVQNPQDTTKQSNIYGNNGIDIKPSTNTAPNAEGKQASNAQNNEISNTGFNTRNGRLFRGQEPQTHYSSVNGQNPDLQYGAVYNISKVQYGSVSEPSIHNSVSDQISNTQNNAFGYETQSNPFNSARDHRTNTQRSFENNQNSNSDYNVNGDHQRHTQQNSNSDYQSHTKQYSSGTNKTSNMLYSSVNDHASKNQYSSIDVQTPRNPFDTASDLDLSSRYNSVGNQRPNRQYNSVSGQQLHTQFNSVGNQQQHTQYNSVSDQQPITQYNSVSDQQANTQYNSVSDQQPNTQYSSVGNQQSNTQYNPVSDQQPNTQYNSVNNQQPNTQYNSVSDQHPNTQYNSVSDQQRNTQFNSVGDQQSNTQYNFVTDKQPITQYNSVSNQQSNTQYNSVSDQQPNTQYSSVGNQQSNTQYNSVSDQQPNTQYNSVSDQQPNTQHNSVSDQQPNTQFNSVSDQQSNTQYNSVSDQQPNTQYNSVSDQQPNTQYNSVSDHQPNTQFNSVSDQQPNTQYNSVSDQQPNTQYNSVSDQQPNTQFNSVSDQQPNTLYNSLSDQQPNTQFNSVSDQQSNTQYNSVSDQQPNTQYNSVSDQQPNTQFNSVSDQQSNTQYNSVSDQQLNTQYNSVSDQQPNTQYNSVSDQQPNTQYSSVNNQQPNTQYNSVTDQQPNTQYNSVSNQQPNMQYNSVSNQQPNTQYNSASDHQSNTQHNSVSNLQPNTQHNSVSDHQTHTQYNSNKPQSSEKGHDLNPKVVSNNDKTFYPFMVKEHSVNSHDPFATQVQSADVPDPFAQSKDIPDPFAAYVQSDNVHDPFAAGTQPDPFAVKSTVSPNDSYEHSNAATKDNVHKDTEIGYNMQTHASETKRTKTGGPETKPNGNQGTYVDSFMKVNQNKKETSSVTPVRYNTNIKHVFHTTGDKIYDSQIQRMADAGTVVNNKPLTGGDNSLLDQTFREFVDSSNTDWQNMKPYSNVMDHQKASPFEDIGMAISSRSETSGNPNNAVGTFETAVSDHTYGSNPKTLDHINNQGSFMEGSLHSGNTYESPVQKVAFTSSPSEPLVALQDQDFAKLSKTLLETTGIQIPNFNNGGKHEVTISQSDYNKLRRIYSNLEKSSMKHGNANKSSDQVVKSGVGSTDGFFSYLMSNSEPLIMEPTPTSLDPALFHESKIKKTHKNTSEKTKLKKSNTDDSDSSSSEEFSSKERKPQSSGLSLTNRNRFGVKNLHSKKEKKIGGVTKKIQISKRKTMKKIGGVTRVKKIKIKKIRKSSSEEVEQRRQERRKQQQELKKTMLRAQQRDRQEQRKKQQVKRGKKLKGQKKRKLKQMIKNIKRQKLRKRNHQMKRAQNSKEKIGISKKLKQRPRLGGKNKQESQNSVTVREKYDEAGNKITYGQETKTKLSGTTKTVSKDGNPQNSATRRPESKNKIKNSDFKRRKIEELRDYKG